MNDTVITCPHCGGEIPLTEALTAQLHARFDAEHEARLKAAVQEATRRTEVEQAARAQILHKQLEEQAEKARQAELREIESRQKALGLEKTQRQAIEKARLETEEKLRKETETRLTEQLELAQRKAREDALLERQQWEKRLEEERARLMEAQKAELELRQKAETLEAREIQLRQQTLELEQAQQRAIEKARLETEEKLRKETDARLKTLLAQAEQKAREDGALEREQLEKRLAEERQKLEVAQKAELELRQKAMELETRAQEMELELIRRLDEKKTEWENGLRQRLSLEQDLKLKEKEKQIDDMKKVIDDLQRKSQQGSQEMQGEVLELDIQAALERQFPHDLIRPVPKGMSGADLLQEVRDASLNPCGHLIWEVKNTKHWQAAWLDKLKDDQRQAGAALAILVSMALPEGVRGFAQLNGVWVTDRTHYPMLAVALRDQLQQVAYVRTASQGKNEKMEMLYHYLAGDEFRHKVEAIVEAFTAMRAQLDKERRAMTRHWAEREKQIERVIGSTTGMYGALQGIIGQGLAAIPALELDDPPLLEDDD